MESAAAPIRDSKSNVVAILQVDQPVDFIIEQLSELKMRYFTAAALSSFIGIVMSGVLAFMMMRPVRLLQRTSHRFGEGDYSARITKKRNDEFGQLYDAFNVMAENICSEQEKNKRRIQTLEKSARNLKIDAMQMGHVAVSLSEIMEEQKSR